MKTKVTEIFFRAGEIHRLRSGTWLVGHQVHPPSGGHNGGRGQEPAAQQGAAQLRAEGVHRRGPAGDHSPQGEHQSLELPDRHDIVWGPGPGLHKGLCHDRGEGRVESASLRGARLRLRQSGDGTQVDLCPGRRLPGLLATGQGGGRRRGGGRSHAQRLHHAHAPKVRHRSANAGGNPGWRTGTGNGGVVGVPLYLRSSM